MGAAVLVYPGGDWETHRPSWESAKIDFAGRKGFIRLAIARNVPVVPVVSIGGQETALFLSRGERLARLLRLDRLARLKVLPISLALPWGLNVGDIAGHIPLPAKITIQVMEPIDLPREFGPEPDVDAGVRRDRRPDAAHARRPRGGAAAAGDRLAGSRCASRSRSASTPPPERVWDFISEPLNYEHFMAGITRWDVEGEQRPAPARGMRCG